MARGDVLDVGVVFVMFRDVYTTNKVVQDFHNEKREEL